MIQSRETKERDVRLVLNSGRTKALNKNTRINIRHGITGDIVKKDIGMYILICNSTYVVHYHRWF